MSGYPHRAEHALPQDIDPLYDLFANHLLASSLSSQAELSCDQNGRRTPTIAQSSHDRLPISEREEPSNKIDHEHLQHDRGEIGRKMVQSLENSSSGILHASRYGVASLAEPQNKAELSRIGIQSQKDLKFERRISRPANFSDDAHRRPLSLAADQSLSPMQPLPYLKSGYSSPLLQIEGERKYSPFQNRFRTSEEAKNYRRLVTRFDRQPYRPPDSDPSIAAIESERQVHVERIYNAMTRSDLARDNSNSIARKRWAIQPHYKADLVEAFAHKVFDSLLEQAKEGFRGWHHNDYVVDDRKGEDEDRDVSCAGRLDNIVSALEFEKTICEDVMNSTCQIRMFVNAPKAYANRKHQNRIGNSKRGRTKETPEPPSSAKRLKVFTNRPMRTRSSTTSDIPTVQHPVQHIHSRLATGVSYLTPKLAHNFPHAAMCSVSHQHSSIPNRLMSVKSNPLSPRQITGTSFSPRSPNVQPQRIQSLPPQPQPHMPLSPSSLGKQIRSASSSSNNVQGVPGATESNPWQFISHPPHLGSSQFSTSNMNDIALMGSWASEPLYSPHTHTESANLFEQHPEAAVSHGELDKTARVPSTRDPPELPDFLDFWEQQPGIQPISYNGPSTDFKLDP